MHTGDTDREADISVEIPQRGCGLPPLTMQAFNFPDVNTMLELLASTNLRICMNPPCLDSRVPIKGVLQTATQSFFYPISMQVRGFAF